MKHRTNLEVRIAHPERLWRELQNGEWVKAALEARPANTERLWRELRDGGLFPGRTRPNSNCHC